MDTITSLLSRRVNDLLPYPTPSELLIWTISAVVSLSSSKYIIVDLGLHYPFLLHFVQFTTVTILSMVLQWIPGGCDYLAPYLWKKSNTSSSLLDVVPIPLLAASSALTLQTILHLPNLATVTMLPIVCYLFEQIASGTANFGMHVRPVSVFATLVLCICCRGLFHGERRMTVLSLPFAFPATVLLGVSLSLSKNYWPGNSCSPRLYTFLLFFLSLVVSGTLVFFKEQNSLNELHLFREHAVVLVINTASSAIAISMGGSILVPIGFPNSPSPLVITSCLGGLTGCASLVLLQRCYTNLVQLCSYGVALASLSYLWKEKLLNHYPHCPLSTASSVLPTEEEPLCGGRDRGFSGQSCYHCEATPDEGNASRCTTSSVHLAFTWYLPVGVGLAAWIFFLIFNFSPALLSSNPLHSANLDDTYQTNTLVEVVISMYEEPVESVAQLISSLQAIPTFSQARMHIYTKASMVNVTTLQEDSGAHTVTRLPNVGREAETYLHHILSHWDTLAKHTLFIQAGVHDEEAFLWRLKSHFDPQRTGMLNLSPFGHVLSCGGSDSWGWRDDSSTIPRLFERIYHAPCQEFLLSYKGQFLVSAQRIRGIERDIYSDLHSTLVEEEGWAHREPYLQGRGDSMSAPIFGYDVERLWALLFQCADRTVTGRCPGGVYPEGAAGSRAECQCLDR